MAEYTLIHEVTTKQGERNSRVLFCGSLLDVKQFFNAHYKKSLRNCPIRLKRDKDNFSVVFTEGISHKIYYKKSN